MRGARTGFALRRVNESIVENGSSKAETLGSVTRLPGTNDSCLAEHVAVLLTGYLLRHLEKHFDQRVYRQLLWTLEQYTGLADVLDRTLEPCTDILHAVTDWAIKLEAPSTRNPGRLLSMRPALRSGFGRASFYPLRATHGLPVVLVLSRAQQADLIELSVRVATWPGKLVGAAT